MVVILSILPMSYQEREGEREIEKESERDRERKREREGQRERGREGESKEERLAMKFNGWISRLPVCMFTYIHCLPCIQLERYRHNFNLK